MTDVSALFQPLTIRGVTIPNRIAMAPMTRSFSRRIIMRAGLRPMLAF